MLTGFDEPVVDKFSLGRHDKTLNSPGATSKARVDKCRSLTTLLIKVPLAIRTKDQRCLWIQCQMGDIVIFHGKEGGKDKNRKACPPDFPDRSC